MNLGVIRERNPRDGRTALTPPVVRHLTAQGAKVWVESGAGDGALFPDQDYLRAGAQIGYSAAEVIQRSEVLVKIVTPAPAELELCEPGTAVLAFFHLAVAPPAVYRTLIERRLGAIALEMIRDAHGRLPVLAAASGIAGQMTVPIAAHLLRSSSGGRGILIGGSPGVPPASIVVLGAGVVGTWAARTARAAGASVTVMDIDAERLRKLLDHVPGVATAFAEPESVAAAVAAADVVVGAVLIAGAKTPHVVTREMVERMRPGSVIIDVSIDQGGCVETSRPTTIADPTFVRCGVIHYCVPNLTAEIGRSASMAIAQSLLPYLSEVASLGIEEACRRNSALAAGVCTRNGEYVSGE